MNYTLTLYNAVDGETALPLIGFTLRKRIDEAGLLETAATLTLPSSDAETVSNRTADEIRLYQDAVLIYTGQFVSIKQDVQTATLKALSAIAAPSPVTVSAGRIGAAFLGEGYSRLRIPSDFSINPGDSVDTDFITLIAAKVTNRISLNQAFTEVTDNAAG